MKLQVSPPIICFSTENEYSLEQARVFIHLVVFLFWGVIMGFSIAILTYTKTREPVELYSMNGLGGLLTSFFCSFWILFCFNHIQRRHVDIRILDEKLRSIELNNNYSYVPYLERRLLSYQGAEQWSKFMDISEGLKKFRWECQVLLYLLSIILVLEILLLSFVEVSEFNYGFILLAIMTSLFIYGNLRFIIFGMTPVFTLIKAHPINTRDDNSYIDELTTLFEFIRTATDPLQWLLYMAGFIGTTTVYIISLFYFSS